MKVIRDIDYEDYIKSLKEQGYEAIGTGLYATAYAKSGHNRVLKVYSRDESYHSFIQRVKNLKNPYFPKVYSITKYANPKEEYNKVGGVWYAVELERLKHIEDLQINEQEDLLVEFDIDETDYIDSGFSNSEYLSFNDVIEEGGWGECNIQLGRAIDIIDKLLRNGDCILDLHGRNVMVRREPKGNRLVFTDPLYNGDNPYRPSY
jgi:hypothetical protein